MLAECEAVVMGHHDPEVGASGRRRLARHRIALLALRRLLAIINTVALLLCRRLVVSDTGSIYFRYYRYLTTVVGGRETLGQSPRKMQDARQLRETRSTCQSPRRPSLSRGTRFSGRCASTLPALR